MTSKRVRCAIYTRKSTEEGLDKAFNTLEAQREACEAFVKSQAGEGWVALREKYDDGGFSGGSLDRPALQRLLAHVDEGRIDIVLVYKVDRLTRSLADFAKIVERFEAHNASFVSVTQSFNTATSMGRLTLNVLLSFAQYEREIAGERIRDKIAASRRKGMWTGGSPPLGYDIVDKKLVVNASEAKTVRHIFKRYLELGSVQALRDDLDAEGVVSKRRKSTSGRVWGGTTLHRGVLYTILKNRTYIGEMTHKDNAYPGEHKAILPRDLFERAQHLLAENRNRNGEGNSASDVNLLTGLIFDDRGNRMSPAHARKKDGRRYRYYVSGPVQVGEKSKAGSISRVSAPAIEAIVTECLIRLANRKDSASPPDGSHQNYLIRQLVRRIEVHARAVVIHLDRAVALGSIGRQKDSSTGILPDHSVVDDTYESEALNHFRERLGQNERLDVSGDQFLLRLAGAAKPKSGPRRLASFDSAQRVQLPRADPALIKAIVRAHAWLKLFANGEIASVDELARSTGQHRNYVRQILRLAFLSPAITKLILQGRQPAHLSLALLFRTVLRLSWKAQPRQLEVYGTSQANELVTL